MSAGQNSVALLDRLRGGDSNAIGELFELHRERLWRMLYVRMDSRLARRVSVEDVLQDAFLDVARRVGEWLAESQVPFYVWLRFLTLQRMQALQRTHLGAQMRDAGQEVCLTHGGLVVASSESMAGQLVSHVTSPSQAAMRRELQERLRAALDEMEALDREVLALRHFEELTNNEVAVVLGITKEAASKRHVRALKRLRSILEEANEPTSG